MTDELAERQMRADVKQDGWCGEIAQTFVAENAQVTGLRVQKVDFGTVFPYGQGDDDATADGCQTSYNPTVDRSNPVNVGDRQLDLEVLFQGHETDAIENEGNSPKKRDAGQGTDIPDRSTVWVL